MQPIPMFKLGAVVYRTDDHSPDGKEDVGHIKGFSRNSTDELILIVQFSRMETLSKIHPANVRVYD